jgi:hypothetical protein
MSCDANGTVGDGERECTTTVADHFHHLVAERGDCIDERGERERTDRRSERPECGKSGERGRNQHAGSVMSESVG